jgi:hypothetical protein
MSNETNVEIGTVENVETEIARIETAKAALAKARESLSREARERLAKAEKADRERRGKIGNWITIATAVVERTLNGKPRKIADLVSDVASERRELTGRENNDDAALNLRRVLDALAVVGIVRIDGDSVARIGRVARLGRGEAAK